MTAITWQKYHLKNEIHDIAYKNASRLDKLDLLGRYASLYSAYLDTLTLNELERLREWIKPAKEQDEQNIVHG